MCKVCVCGLCVCVFVCMCVCVLAEVISHPAATRANLIWHFRLKSPSARLATQWNPFSTLSYSVKPLQCVELLSETPSARLVTQWNPFSTFSYSVVRLHRPPPPTHTHTHTHDARRTTVSEQACSIRSLTLPWRPCDALSQLGTVSVCLAALTLTQTQPGDGQRPGLSQQTQD